MPVATMATPSTRSRYTYDQFRQAAQSSGLLGEFSDADLSLAQQNPDAGMSLLGYKRDWHNATTDADRELANLGAERIRSSYGSYIGGDDGSHYHLESLSPNMFEYPDAPTYTGSGYGDTAGDLLDQMINYGDFEYGPAPEYESRWDPTILELIDGILNREEFSYDPATDPLYQNYRQQYTREGQRATADALGAAAAASGGLPSSYAQTAANQQANYYAAQLTDMIPELYQLAYNKYLTDYDMMLSDLGVVQGQEATDYSHYLNDLTQYNTDRAFDYGAYLDRYDMLSNNMQAAQSMDDLEFERFLAELDQYNTDRNFYYGQHLDEITDQQNDFATAVDMAQLGADYGDLRGLEDLGIDLSALRAAQEAATGGSPTGNPGTPGDGGGDEPDAGDGGDGDGGDSISPGAMSILSSYLHINPGTNSNVASIFGTRISNALSAGQITQEEADYLRDMIGI